MKVTLNKNELGNVLGIAFKAITGKSTMPILEGFKLDAKDGALTITGSDLDLTIKTSVAGLVEEEGSLVLDKRFLDIVKKMPEEKILLETKKDNKINIKSGKSLLKMGYMSSKEYPKIVNNEKSTAVKINSDVLKDLLKSTFYAIAQDEARPILTGVLFEVKDKELSIVSLDGYRMAIKKTTIDSPDFAVVVPGKTVNELIKLLPSNSEVSLNCNENYIIFEFDGTIVSSKLLEGQYVNYRALIPSDNKISLTIDKAKMLEMLDRACLIQNASYLIKLSLNAASNQLHSKCESTFGVIDEELDCSIIGEDLEIAFNTKYLIDSCKATNSEEVTFYFNNGVTPCTIKGEDYLHLLLPVRIIK